MLHSPQTYSNMKTTNCLVLLPPTKVVGTEYSPLFLNSNESTHQSFLWNKIVAISHTMRL